jgi:hypothetical protein
MIKKTVYALIILLFLTVGILWYMDYEKVNKGFEPKFCLKEELYTFNDGDVKLCRGLGYNILRYDRVGNKKTVVGPFWIEIEK